MFIYKGVIYNRGFGKLSFKIFVTQCLTLAPYFLAVPIMQCTLTSKADACFKVASQAKQKS